MTPADTDPGAGGPGVEPSSSSTYAGGRVSPVEPHLTLAFALRASPGGYALLLGAGVSASSGVPTAWGVQDLLLRDLARVQGEDPGQDAFAWYHRRYGTKATYDALLSALTHSQAERQALLRPLFEPDEAEREQGLKRPAPAHRAVARLVSAGLVSVVLTTNFDRLVEAALREEGVEPTVVTNPDDVVGLKPLHVQRALVVHLHGDYLDPTGMLNTAEELATYPRELNGLLGKVLPNYGLIVAGWSAEYDTALRRAIARNPNRFFPTYWVDVRPLRDAARRLQAQRDATYVHADADGFLGSVADACESLAQTARRDPLTVPVAVATAKRALSGGRVAIPLHDSLRAELDALRRLDVLVARSFDATDVEALYRQRLARLFAALEVPLALVSTTAYWGDRATDRWWLGDVARLATRPSASGATRLIRLVQLPATAVIYAAGITATAAGRDDLVVELLTGPTVDDEAGARVPVAAHLTPAEVLGSRDGHLRLHEYLRPILQDHLGLGPGAYADASERLEYVRLVQDAFTVLRSRGRDAEGPAWDRDADVYRARVDNAAIHRPEVAEAEQREFRDAQAEADQRRASRAALVRLESPHIRALGHSHHFVPAPSPQLAAELARQGAAHPLLSAGLCGGEPDQLRWAMAAVDDAFNRHATDAAHSTTLRQPGGVGFIPSGPFYPDELLAQAGAPTGPHSPGGRSDRCLLGQDSPRPPHAARS